MAKPLVVGESGATYYGKPRELFPFVGLKAYGSYHDRNEALAIDVYQNAVQLARPYLAWYSPSELCWFGIEHLNLGYHDYSRLPDLRDGIFPVQPYVEGKPGYQYERIPPYVTTFNPGLDPALPLYKPLPMFHAFKAAISGESPLPSKWDHYQDTPLRAKPIWPTTVYHTAYFIGDLKGKLAGALEALGLELIADVKATNLLVIDGENVTGPELEAALPLINKVKKQGGLVWIMLADQKPAGLLSKVLPASVELVDASATAMQNNEGNIIGRYFDLRKLYFSEMVDEGNEVQPIVKKGLGGALIVQSNVVFEAVNTDWSLFNNVPENRKCAQVVLYENLQKPRNVTMATVPFDQATLAISSIDYRIVNRETLTFWKDLFTAMGIKNKNKIVTNDKSKKDHDLLMDGPKQ